MPKSSKKKLIGDNENAPLKDIVVNFVEDNRTFEVVKRELFVYPAQIKTIIPSGKVVKVTLELADNPN